MPTSEPTIEEVLLRRRGLLYPEGAGNPLEDRYLQAIEIELSELGYALSARLRGALARLSLEALATQRTWIRDVLGAHRGSDQKHTTLFRRFPEAIPPDTGALWMQKVLCHFLQAEDQSCLFCRRAGTTHVLDPCLHVVCDHCFDGSNYSACPVCEHHVDLSSPFFQPTPQESQNFPPEPTRLELLDLGASIDADAKALFLSFCARVQAMSPTDRDDLATLVRHNRMHTLAWIPDEVPVKENIAIIFGTLFAHCDPSSVLPAAQRHLATATDVLRLIAAYSGADPSLQAETIYRKVPHFEPRARWWGRVLELLGADPSRLRSHPALIPIRVHRFKVAKLSRPLRRSFLTLLESFDPDLLAEDMLRHRSYWVWLGEFLHPTEYAKRFPNTARAFSIVRKKSPAGKPAPAFSTYYARLESAAQAADVSRFTALLVDRPGELARRFDHALRLAGSDPTSKQHVIEAFTGKIEALSAPVLLTLQSFLPTRIAPVPRRVFWPKGGVGRSVTVPDRRAPLDADAVTSAVFAIRAELLRRFASKSVVHEFVLDAALRQVLVPFNERTASRAAVSLPRGSRLFVPEGKLVRLFLHWCQPARGGFETDLDLSVAFYDASWSYLGLCSYYQLSHPEGEGVEPIAHSAGDLRDAPHPDGATELVDLDIARAKAAGIRYAVMVVNAYAGMPFALLERVYAGVMLRDSEFGQRFDPRTVELKFSLAGEHGIYMPLVLDIEERRLHWLDVFSQGEFSFNNVATSNKAITRICPELMEYFERGERMSMYDLGLLHAAARARRVYVRGERLRRIDRRPGESPLEFLGRLRAEEGETLESLPRFEQPILALLLRGDIEIPPGSDCYALFREQLAPNLAASDLIG